jgi:hypothetical protein
MIITIARHSTRRALPTSPLICRAMFLNDISVMFLNGRHHLSLWRQEAKRQVLQFVKYLRKSLGGARRRPGAAKTAKQSTFQICLRA